MQSAIFKNRIDAGKKIAKRLSWLKQDRLKEERSQQSIILAIPHGGVVIGDVIASELAINLNVVVSQRIRLLSIVSLQYGP